MSTSVEPRGWAKAALHVNGWFVYMFFYVFSKVPRTAEN